MLWSLDTKVTFNGFVLVPSYTCESLQQLHLSLLVMKLEPKRADGNAELPKFALVMML